MNPRIQLPRGTDQRRLRLRRTVELHLTSGVLTARNFGKGLIQLENSSTLNINVFSMPLTDIMPQLRRPLHPGCQVRISSHDLFLSI